MGFMAGFGPAFGEAFNKGLDRQQKKADDMFKMQFQKYLEDEKDRKEQDRKAGYAIQQAQKLVEETGQPPEVVGRIASDLQAGVSYEQMRKSLEEGKYTVSSTSAGMKVSDEPVTQASATSPVDPRDQQTQDAFSKGVQEKVAIPGGNVQTGTNTSTPPTGVSSNVSTPSAPRPQGPAGSKFRQVSEANIKKIAEATGEDPAEVRRKMTSPYESPIQKLQNPNLKISYVRSVAAGKDFVDRAKAIYLAEQYRAVGDEATAKKYDAMVQAHVLDDQLTLSAKEGQAMFIVRDPETGQITHTPGRRGQDGKIIGPDNKQYDYVRDVGKEEEAVWREFGADNKDLSEFNRKQVDLASMYKTADRYFALLGDDSLSLTTTGKVSQVIDRIKREAENYVKLASSATSSPDTETNFRKLEGEIDGAIKSGAIKDVADRTSLLNSLKTIMMYRAGALEGQSARDLSDKDVARMETIIQSSTDPKVVKQQIAEFLAEKTNEIKSSELQFNQNNRRISMLNSVYKYSPITETVTDFDTFMKQSGAAGAYENVNSAVGSAVKTGPTTGAVSTPTSKAEYDALPSGAKYQHPSDPPGQYRTKK